MIRIDCAWLAVQPLDMRAGTDTALGRVVQVFGAAHPHHAYLFANRRANRMKVLVHDGIGIWLAARRRCPELSCRFEPVVMRIMRPS
jgi:transposase